jgi:hypothetical protein
MGQMYHSMEIMLNKDYISLELVSSFWCCYDVSFNFYNLVDSTCLTYIIWMYSIFNMDLHVFW